MPTPLPRIYVSDNRRTLVTETGEPFFWLGDTAWELFHRLTREEVRYFFATRQQQRFTVIQAVALAEFEGLTVANVYGDAPLHDLDPTKPNDAYFRLVDEYIDLAAEHQLYIGFLPTWGDKVTAMWGAGPQVFTVENARIYGEFLGRRYANRSNILWILGGDRPPVYAQDEYRHATANQDDRPLWRAMAEGIVAGVGATRKPFMTYHPPGGRSTSQWLHDEAWLDMHMMQSGHGSGRDVPVWQMIQKDYALTPVKPTLDGEPNYEDHPVNPWPQWNPNSGYYRDHDVRKQLYRSVFAGGCGVTYGHHAVWQFFDPAKRAVVNHADRPWQEAIRRAGAQQARHLRALLESRPMLTRIPDQTLLRSPEGIAESHVQATRDEAGSYAMIYLPIPQTLQVDLAKLAGGPVRGWWFNPRTGVANEIGVFAPQEVVTLSSPVDGPDWVLVLDQFAAGYGVPGA